MEMKTLIGICFLVFIARIGLAQPPLEPGLFQAGVYGDIERTVTCVTGPTGSTFEQSVWAWVPVDEGLAYITLRFQFPGNLDLSDRPQFHPQITHMIITDFPGDSVEWNMVFEGCPSGWVLVFTQECTILDEEPGRIEILADHSMMRDCQMVLNDLFVLEELSVNDPDCLEISTDPMDWGQLKIIYR